MTTTLCNSGQALFKAGRKVYKSFISGANTESLWNQFINEAEAYLNIHTKYNWIDNYASLNADVKLIAQEFCSNLAAIYAITYDMSGYTSRQEAENMINILYARNQELLELLKDQATNKFIQGS